MMEENGKKMKRIYSVGDFSALNPDLKKYCQQSIIKRAKFNENIEKHSYVTEDNRERVCNGLHSYIYLIYTPKKYVQPHRTHSKINNYIGKPATREIGIGVSKRIERVVENNGNRCCCENGEILSLTEQKILNYSNKILDWLERKKYDLQVAELPVVMKNISRMTRVDLITLDRRKTGLVVWEIKCGWPPSAVYNEHKFKAPLDDINCSSFNKWFIQALYTNAGLKKLGLATVCIKILHCWEYEDEDTQENMYKVVSRDLPPWALEHENFVLNLI